MDKTFSKLKVGEYIARVEGYKVESAKVLKIDKVSKDKKVFLLKGTETKKKYTFESDNTTSMFGLVSGERYYADGAAVSFLRDGIEIGFEYARKQVVESFKQVYPYFTVNGRLVEFEEPIFEVGDTITRIDRNAHDYGQLLKIKKFNKVLYQYHLDNGHVLEVNSQNHYRKVDTSK
jgi:hypothetical protein